MENLTIKIRSEDVAMLRRIAESENRRFEDFLQLVLSSGLEIYFCEEVVSVKKLPDEYTEEELKQQEINNKIKSEDHEDYESMRAAGFRSVRDYFTNHDYDPETKEYSDNLIAPLCNRIRKLAVS